MGEKDLSLLMWSFVRWLKLNFCTISHPQNVVGVTIGGTLGHALCTGLAVIGGRLIAQRISVRTGAYFKHTLFSYLRKYVVKEEIPLSSVTDWQLCCRAGGWQVALDSETAAFVWAQIVKEFKVKSTLLLKFVENKLRVQDLWNRWWYFGRTGTSFSHCLLSHF